jgi:DNA primase
MRRLSKEQILSSIKISDIADRFGISMIESPSGNFTHKCKCPGKDHKGGTERTGSLFVDNDNNNYYCFGCGSSNNVIDFYMLCSDKTFSEAIEDISGFVDKANLVPTKTVVKGSIFTTILNLSHFFRETMLRHPDDIEWIESVMKKSDFYISGLDRHDVEGAEKLYLKVKKVIYRRYS